MRIVIAVDAMGGDNAPFSVVKGVELAVKSVVNGSNDVFFRLFGRAEELKPLIDRRLEGRCEIVDVPDVIASDAKPSLTIRHGKSSSMYKAIESVAEGTADCIISAGNTGAMVVLSRYKLGMLPGVSRPVIAGIVPCAVGDFVMLDLGANVDCNADSLYQFSVMGYAFAKSYFHNKKIRVGLLNIGSEHIKGNDSVKEAFTIISENTASIPDLDFIGYVEPVDVVLHNKVDVLVVDGFSGNLSLKMSEAFVHAFILELKKIKKSSLVGALAMLIAKPFIRRALNHFNPSKRNGAMLAGVQGVVIKSHGSANAEEFSYALGVAVSAVSDKVNNRIVMEMGVGE